MKKIMMITAVLIESLALSNLEALGPFSPQSNHNMPVNSYSSASDAFSPPSLLDLVIGSTVIFLRWTPVKWADSYEIQLSQCSEFSTIYQHYSSNSSAYELPRADFSPGTTYYVQIRAVKNTYYVGRGRPVNVTHRSDWSNIIDFTLTPIKETIESKFPTIKITEKGRSFSTRELEFILHCLEVLPPHISRLITEIQACEKNNEYCGRASFLGRIELCCPADISAYMYLPLAHEIGHIVHFKSKSIASENLRRFINLHISSSDYNDFVWEYGRTSWMEDFATIFEAYMLDSKLLIDIARARQSSILLEKLKIVIKAFQEGDMVYVYKCDTYAKKFTMQKVKLGADGLPEF